MPVPQRMSFIVEQASCLFLNGQDARSTKNEFYCGTGILPVPGKMPVPQRMSFIVEQASCLFLNGQDARSTKNEFYCGTGILPVPKQVIEKGVRCELS
jgi:hypothetical protein